MTIFNLAVFLKERLKWWKRERLQALVVHAVADERPWVDGLRVIASL